MSGSKSSQPENNRASGVLLHVTSLPSRFGIGDLGPAAYAFVDRLVEAGQQVWQVLPLVPIDQGQACSPYSSSSAYAGNTYLVSPEQLASDGYLESSDLADCPDFPDGRVDFATVLPFKTALLQKAWQRYQNSVHRCALEDFCRLEASWLDTYAQYEVAKAKFGHRPWNEWPEPLRNRDEAALTEFRAEHRQEFEQVQFGQFLFWQQWSKLKAYANTRGVEILGDIPIYVNYDSADTWSSPHLFKLDKNHQPEVVAGVPPDYFSQTGQLWGNPVYDWKALKQENYQWWLDRLAHVFRLYDRVRIDHFRGLVAFWEVPAENETAIDGEWVEAPVEDFLDSLRQHFGTLPVVAEDLGIITENVQKVMDTYHLPSMKVLAFAFGDDDTTHPYRPENHPINAVVYTGTHDNNTIVGWLREDADEAEQSRVSTYVDRHIADSDIHWSFVKMALKSPARLALVPVQDLLGLDGSARMNTPATVDGNWSWRLTPAQFDALPMVRLAKLTQATGRHRSTKVIAPVSTPQ